MAGKFPFLFNTIKLIGFADYQFPGPPNNSPASCLSSFHLPTARLFSCLISTTVLGWYLNLTKEKRESEREERLRASERLTTVRNIHFNARHLYSPYVLLKCSQIQVLGEAAIQTLSTSCSHRNGIGESGMRPNDAKPKHHLVGETTSLIAPSPPDQVSA